MAENTDKRWLVLYTKPRNEKKVTERLSKKGFEIYCPLVKTLRQWSDRKKKVEVPLFSSYVFIRVDEKERPLALHDPGVMNYVFWLGKPAVVRDSEIDAFRQIVENGEEVVVESSRLEKGSKVEIEEGPFKGMTGIVDKLNPQYFTLYIEQLDCKVSFQYTR
ncbi:MAG: UpxY family transcription antiterminator [Cyclobacteriaceae bacterium]